MSSVASSALRTLVVGATGGLGRCLVHESLSQGHTVSVLVRSQDKLNATFDANTVKRLSAIHIGDSALDRPLVSRAVSGGVDVLLNGCGSQPAVAAVLAEQCKLAGVKKLIHVAGATNLKSEDGVTDNWMILKPKLGDWVERAYLGHKACIDAIAKSGINFVIFCPSLMRNMGHKSSNLPDSLNIRINRPSGDFISYEDAAYVMVRAAMTNEYDGQCITASTKQ